MPNQYERFSIARPPHMSENHWRCIATEVDRIGRSIDANDAGQALSDLKCLVEAAARITMDIDGSPAEPSASFDSIVNRAHQLLAGQPGYDITREPLAGRVASQASKIARNLGDIRNEYGGGHGRSRTPEFAEEMLSLALDGGLLWVRWALRRIGYFAKGRPESLINDLIGTPQSFYSGSLRERLDAANLPALEPKHQRSIGIAVGQRVMRETFVVRWDGLNPPLQSNDLNEWPRGYRLGLAFGLWFSPEGHLTLSTRSVTEALTLLEPISDAGPSLAEMVDRITAIRPVGGLTGNFTEDLDLVQSIRRRAPLRPPDEAVALGRLADLLQPEPPF